MFSKNSTTRSTIACSENRILTKELLSNAEAVVIGAGAGLSAAAGLVYEGRRFTDNFKEFIERYGMTDMYTAGFYPFATQEEKWAYWSRHILVNRYEAQVGKPYLDLLELVREKEYFVITTNVDHQFQLAGFPEEKIFAVQGDYGLFQCKRACHNLLYDNQETVKKMVKEQKNCRIPTALIPKCPVCGGEMEVNLRRDNYFVEEENWHKANENYVKFLREHRNDSLVFLELGVGMNTPAIIKIPFMQMTAQFLNAHMISINQMSFAIPDELTKKIVCIAGDIREVLADLQ